MHLGLDGKIVIVTGGTKSIGRAIVEAFLDEGAIVHFCARNSSDVTSSASAWNANRSTQRAWGATVDVSNGSHINDWISAVLQQHSRIDVVVSNVSALSIPNTPDSWTIAFQTDMLATVNLVNATQPYLEANKGAIVTISSVSGRDVDFTAPGPYGAFKAALVHYTAQLAHTLAPKGVRANTVSPGNIYVGDGVWGGIEKGNPDLFKAQMAKNPMGRMGKPREVADAVVWLASERAGFVSGTNFVVDGALCTGVQL